MCLTPLKIGNPTRRFVHGLSRPILTVRCNHCSECVKQIQDDWFVRSLFEARRVQSSGGAVWVPILTYRNEDLPRWIDKKHNMNIPCFEKAHFKSFRNKLRVYLGRDLYLRKNEEGELDLVSRRKGSKPIDGDKLVWRAHSVSEENTIRYIYCCEYGEKKGRSHIHALLFVPFYIPASVMARVIRKCWIYGHVRFSKEHGMIAQGLAAAQYATKYIVKDMLWTKRYNIDDYVETLKEDISRCRDIESADIAKDVLCRFRRVMPHHCQSMGFGVDGLDYFRLEDGSWNKDKLTDGRLSRSSLGLPPTKRGTNFNFNMPSYYVRKIFYNRDDWNLYRLNPLGQEIFAARFELSLLRAADRFTNYVSSPYILAAHLAPLGLSQRVLDDLWTTIKVNMRNRNAKDLALFDKVYRDIEGVDDDETPEGYYCSNQCLIRDMSKMSERAALDFLRDNALDFMLAQKTIDREPDPERVKHKDNWHVNELSFNMVPCFEGFSQVLSIIEDYEHKLGELCQTAYEQKREREEKVKQFMPDPYSDDISLLYNSKIY